MGKFFDHIEPHHKAFIEKQHIFFVATAPLSAEGRVNVSPKGLDAFRVLSENQVGYMDIISSGNETSAHTLENGRITIMLCSFEGNPNIMRLYGRGRTILPDSEEWATFAPHFNILPSTRQLMIADIDLVQTSCGFGVPLYDYAGERSIHFEWAEKKGQQGLETYLQEKNLVSLDGLDTDWGVRLKDKQ
jgi:hypothetical protein